MKTKLAVLPTFVFFLMRVPLQALDWDQPRFISPNYPEDNGFVRYDAHPKKAPFGEDIRIDGTPWYEVPNLKLFDVFTEDSWAKLPPQTCIQRYVNNRGFEFWSHPKGTSFIHRLFLKTSPPRLYELRQIEKMEDGPGGRWAFRRYVTTQDPNNLKLWTFHPDDWKYYHELQFSLPATPRDMTVTLKRYTRQCTSCHVTGSQNNLIDGSPRVAGPCGFTPMDLKADKQWAKSLEEWVAAYTPRYNPPFCPEIKSIP
ncbi:MAG: hypothetical protein HY399_08170 [Elusimicrobia bacterium]|nr:hypothetical protein [Elusimicrobiota bacterium]